MYLFTTPPYPFFLMGIIQDVPLILKKLTYCLIEQFLLFFKKFWVAFQKILDNEKSFIIDIEIKSQ